MRRRGVKTVVIVSTNPSPRFHHRMVGRWLARAADDMELHARVAGWNVVRLRDPKRGKLVRTLSQHTDLVLFFGHGTPNYEFPDGNGSDLAPVLRNGHFFSVVSASACYGFFALQPLGQPDAFHGYDDELAYPHNLPGEGAWPLRVPSRSLLDGLCVRDATVVAQDAWMQEYQRFRRRGSRKHNGWFVMALYSNHHSCRWHGSPTATA